VRMPRGRRFCRRKVHLAKKRSKRRREREDFRHRALVLQRLLVREMAQKDASAGNVGAADPEPRAQRDAFPRRAKGAERTQSRQRVESAMQDIEIHIGRIEVIAVPPPRRAWPPHRRAGR